MIGIYCLVSTAGSEQHWCLGIAGHAGPNRQDLAGLVDWVAAQADL